MLTHIAFTIVPITCAERVDTRRERSLASYDEKLQTFVLSNYVKGYVTELEQDKLPDLLALKYHAICDAAAQIGGVARIRDAFVGFQRTLYDV